MNFKPKTLMIASLVVVLTAMSTTTWAQKVETKPDPQQKRKQPERQRPQQRRVTQIAKIGKPAPNFKLKDSSGKNHILADYKGKIVVLQWINPVSCPVCKRVNSTGVTSNMLKTIKGIDSDFVHLTIDSTSGQEITKSAAFLTKYDIKSPALDDTSGRIGRMYGAKTTPHMFVIDKEGILRYSGAIDDDQHGRKTDGTTNYVVNAIQQIVANETVTPDSTKSYGCKIRYASREGRDAGGRRGSRMQWLTRHDTNEDGNLDAEELEAIPEEQRNRILERFDANKDGTIDKEEIKALMERQGGREGRGERRGRRGGRGGDGGAGGGGKGGKGGDGG